VGGDEIEESRFRLGVAECLQSSEMGRGDRHRGKIPDFRQETPGSTGSVYS
jgi:hypothetical protein